MRKVYTGLPMLVAACLSLLLVTVTGVMETSPWFVHVQTCEMGWKYVGPSNLPVLIVAFAVSIVGVGIALFMIAAALASLNGDFDGR